MTGSLSSDAEKNVDKLTLTYRIALREPTNLPFANRVHCFVALNGPPGSFRRSESQARDNLLLDETVVLFHDIV